MIGTEEEGSGGRVKEKNKVSKKCYQHREAKRERWMKNGMVEKSEG